jgi:hypothetical protein
MNGSSRMLAPAFLVFLKLIGVTQRAARVLDL